MFRFGLNNLGPPFCNTYLEFKDYFAELPPFTMQPRNFTLPRSTQSSSLFRLPTEIRLIILRLLLVKGNDELQHPAAVQRNNDIRAGWSLLQTCQVMYDEGEPIFYDENKLDLSVKYDAHHLTPKFTITSNIMAFQSQVFINVSNICPLPSDFTIESDGFNVTNTLNNETYLARDGSRDRFVDVLKQFKHMEIDLAKCHHQSRVLAVVVRLLEPLVRGKQLVIKYNLGSSLTSNLECCRWLNCASLKIVSKRHTQEVAQFLQNWAPNTVQVDTYGEWYTVFRGTIQSLPKREINGQEISLVDQRSGGFLLIDQFALAYDVAACATNLDPVDGIILNWAQAWWAEKWMELQIARQMMRERIQKSDGIVDRGKNKKLSDRVQELTKPIEVVDDDFKYEIPY